MYLLIFSIFLYQSQTINIGNAAFSKQEFKVGKGESSIAIDDFNADKHLDIVVTNLIEENALVFLGNGQGHLTQIGNISAGKSPTSVTTSDINDDGFVDMIIANHETSYITILNGDGHGNFTTAKNSPYAINVNPHPHVVLLKDINGDKKTDLIVDNRSTNSLLVLLGMGNNKFEKNSLLIDVGGDPYRGFEIADINNDNLLDIVTPNTNDVSILLNTKSNDFFFDKKSIKTESPFSVKLADINGDEKIDLIVASSGNSVTVILGDGHGNFLETQKTVFNMGQGAKQIAVGDINGDGIKDVFVSSWNNGLMVILGGEKNFETVKIDLQNIPNPWGIELADMNEDGKEDLLITDGSNDSLVLFLSQ